ncbi:MAG: DUF2232 domain-containing protein [Clostridia bacterium]|nr:DUF2232 domain-containing protein [Clostridia bacterium]
MKKESTRALREGAMMVALTVILMLLNKYMPLFSLIGVFVCGVPMAALAARNGFKVIIPAVVSVFLVAILVDGGVIAAVSTILMSVLPGAVAGYMMGRHEKFFMTLFATSLAVCVGWIFELAVLELLVGRGVDELFAEVMQQTQTMLNTTLAALGDALSKAEGMTPEAFAKTFIDMLEFTMRLYFPSIVVVSSMFSGYIIIRISGFIIKRTKLADVNVLPFSHLRAPGSVAFVAVVSYFIAMLSDTSSIFGSVLANVVFILYMILGICGLSFIDFRLKNSIKASVLRFLIYAAVLLFGGIFMGIISNILIIIGILDSSRDFRKIGISE